MVGLNGVQHLKLSEFPILIEKWHDQLPAYFFNNLNTLVVDECTFSSTCVPSNLLLFLNELKVLEVRNCDSLEQVLDFEWSHDFGPVGLLPNLNKFHLIDLPRLRHVWDAVPRESMYFTNLTVLKIHNCSSLRCIFTPTICLGLMQLQEVEVKNCGLVQAIIREGLANEVTVDEITFPLLKSISLESLPSLINFISGSGILHCPSLKEIAIVDCPTIFTCALLRELESNATDGIIEPTHVEFPELDNLKLFSVNIKKIWDARRLEISASIQSLTSLILDGCDHIKYVFSSSMIKIFVHLKKLEICNCNIMEEVITREGCEDESMSQLLLCRLDFLKLKNLPKLKWFCTSNLIDFPVLKELWIQNCPKLLVFVSRPGGANLALSSELEIIKFTLFDEKVCFPKLEKLQILDMNNFKIIPSHMLISVLQNLKNLEIRNCNSLEEVFAFHELIKLKEKLVTETSQLETLVIGNLPNLKHVWNEDPQGIMTFEKLSSVETSECPGIKSLFPASVAKHLPQLETLLLNGCGVEEIVSKGDGVEVEETPSFIFPRLKSLGLLRLQELKCFYSGIHTLECLVLEKLIVYECHKLEIFSYEPQGWQETHIESQQEIQVQQPLFSFRKVVPNLDELRLSCKDILVIQQGHFPPEYFHKLQLLVLQCFDDASVDSPFHPLHIFQKVRVLILGDSDCKVLFPNGIVGERARVLAPLRYLRLGYLSNMRQMWNQDWPSGQILQNLETLEIWNCHSLISLAPVSACFENVDTLDVQRCDGLLYIVTSSVAKSLVHLTKMSVRQCHMLKEVVANGTDELEGDIIFPKLESLRLDCLTRLTRFCSASITIQFPSLKDVEVTQCPNMMDFSRGVIRAPTLERVRFTVEKNKWRWVKDLNTTVQQLYKEMAGFIELKRLDLAQFQQLKELFLHQLPVNLLCNLCFLDVNERAFSSSIIPFNVLPFLNNLEELRVRNCDSVEEVFGLGRTNEHEHVGHLSRLNRLDLIDLPKLRCIWNEIPIGILSFRGLKWLKIYHCNSLTNIFTPAMCLNLVHLKEVEVKCCQMVEEIITEGVAEEGNENGIIFPELTSIALESLPRLINFTSGSYIVQCPSLQEITIVDCPNTFTSVFLRKSESNSTDGITEPKDSFPNLKDLKLSSVGIEKLWGDQQLEISSCIQNLTSLIVYGCGNLKYVLTSSMIRSLVNLKKLEICNCKMMEEVMVTDGLEEELTSKILLNELDFLKLKDLPKLTRLCTSNSVDCPSLKKLWIQNCPELRTFISNPATANVTASSELEIINSALFNEKVTLPDLEELHIFNMDGLKFIWGKELHEHSFCKLKKLNVEHAKELLNIFPPNLVKRFQNVEELNIKSCDSLEEVFDLLALKNLKEIHAATASQLRTLHLCNLPKLKHVWNGDSQGILDFQNLRSVEASECPSLKRLFPCFLARGLLHLEVLEITSCGIEEIVAWDNGMEASVRFEFPQLNSLVLRRLPQLQRFFSGMHILHWPVLKKLRVSQCEGIQKFGSEIQCFTEECTENQLGVQAEQPMLSFAKIIPDLEDLALNSKDVALICRDQFPVDFFRKLKVVELHSFDDKTAVFLFDLLQRFPTLEKLHVSHSEFQELFTNEGLVGEEIYRRTLAQVQSLELEGLSNLENIWHQYSHLDYVFQNLEVLEVRQCNSLFNLLPFSASLENLTTLAVENCKGLVSLMSSSTAKSLVQLRKIRIKNCSSVREIVSSKGDETADEIIFVKLESLELDCLPSLISFCSGNCSFEFPSLTEVIVEQCPQMQVFTEGESRTQKLFKVSLKEDEDRAHWNGNINTTIKHLFKMV